MSRNSVLARGRAFAATGFVDTCLIERVASTDTNPQTAKVTNSWQTIYSGACRFQSAGGASPVTIGESAQYEAPSTVQLPVVGTEDIRIDDRVTVVTSANDSALTGRKYHVTGVHRATHKTARRLSIEELLP